MIHVNTVVFTTDKYFVDDYSHDKEEERVKMMWKDIASFLRILTVQGYYCKVDIDEVDTVVVEYDYADDGMGGPYLQWLTDEECDVLENFRNSSTEEEGSTN